MLAGTEGWKTHAAGESLGCDWLRMWRDITTANPKAADCRNKATVVIVGRESKTAPQDYFSMINKMFIYRES